MWVFIKKTIIFRRKIKRNVDSQTNRYRQVHICVQIFNGQEKRVKWLLNGKNTRKYPHFKVKNKYKRKQHTLISTFKVVSLLFIFFRKVYYIY